jgi:hypothetical protein
MDFYIAINAEPWVMPALAFLVGVSIAIHKISKR